MMKRLLAGRQADRHRHGCSTDCMMGAKTTASSAAATLAVQQELSSTADHHN